MTSTTTTTATTTLQDEVSSAADLGALTVEGRTGADRGTPRFASRTKAYGGSSIWTDILDLLKQHPDPIYFGDGSPAKEAIPLDLMQEAAQEAWANALDVLAYGDQQGVPALRETIARRMDPLGTSIDASEVLVTAGSTQGIELACRVFLDPGDVVIVEEPTFLGALETFSTYEATVVGVPIDEHGMDMDALADVLAHEPRAKLIYTIPTFHNPTGITMPVERRQRLIELAREHNVAILEDDPYVELRYDGEPVPAVKAFDNRVIYLGTFSKTIAPGIRTGWVAAPSDILAMMLSAREVMDISNDRITQRTVLAAAQSELDDRIARAREVYRPRRDAMLNALAEYMPEEVTWSQPEGGFFLWITLPESIDVTTFAHDAAVHGTVVFPGDWFYHDKAMKNRIRLSFSTVQPDRITEGVRRLGNAVREALYG
ncbi:MAG: PLP-dependent aminotransferase family protein [Thermomicrobiales bacterium]